MKRIDFHVHVYDELSVDESVRYFSDMCERFGYDGIGIMALLHCSTAFHPNSNTNSLAIKRLMPGSYAFAGLSYEEDFVEQAERHMDAGFDGIKLLGGKPSQYRLFGCTYTDPRYMAFFEYAEKHQIPLMIHNNDPLMHWDINKISPRSRAKGWYYDETMPSQSYFFDALDRVLAAFPRLKAAIAHFGFYSDDLPRAEAMLETYPNLRFDITPALIIYDELSRTPAQSQAFFTRYHDRLIFGTDAENTLYGRARELNDRKNLITDAFLQGKENEVSREQGIIPLALDAEMLENIYYNNAMRFIQSST